MASQKVAVVTGGNKGIGFEIVKGLCEQFTGVVYLTASDVGRGKAAVENLNKLVEDMVKEVDVESNGRITFKVIVETLGKP